MTTTSLPTLTAQIEERLLAPLRRNALAARGWFGALLAFVLILHGALLALLLHRDSAKPQKVAQETPVEVIVEPPKPEPKPPPEKMPEPPKPQAKPEIEKPASSAPRAPSETKIDTAALQKETHASKAATPPKDGKPEPAKEEAASPAEEKAEPDKVEEKAEAKPEEPEQDREALEKAVPLPPRRPEMKVAKVPPIAKTKREKTALDQLAGASSLPDYSFARPTKKSRVHGGNEDSRYLAIVFGMIMSHRPQVSGPGDGGSVTVAFSVGDDGRLAGMVIQRTSGYPELDSAATTAIRRASPFPPLPPGAPHSLVATIDFSRARPAYTMDDEDR